MFYYFTFGIFFQFIRGYIRQELIIMSKKITRNHEKLDAGQKVIKRGMIEPGGIVMIDKDGKLLQTEEVLRKVHEQVIYRAQDAGEEPSHKYFQDKLDRLLIEEKQIPLADASAEVSGAKKAKSDLNRALNASYWDAESVTDVLFPAAYLGKEALGAMGNDIDPLPKLTGVDGDVFDAHITTFFCQLFAQVSNPPIDSIRERQSFNLRVNLGANVRRDGAKNISFSSPIFTPQDLAKTKSQDEVTIHEIDTTFDIEPGKGNSTEERQAILQEAIKRVLAEVDKAAREDGILVLTDKKITDNRNKAAIPDIIIAAAVKRYLTQKGLDDKVSIVTDSCQIVGPHRNAALLAVGANATYPRSAYDKIAALHKDDTRFQDEDVDRYLSNY